MISFKSDVENDIGTYGTCVRRYLYVLFLKESS